MDRLSCDNEEDNNGGGRFEWEEGLVDLWVFWQWWWIYGFLWVTGGGKFSCSGCRVAILVVSGSGGSYCKSVKERERERQREREREL